MNKKHKLISLLSLLTIFSLSIFGGINISNAQTTKSNDQVNSKIDKTKSVADKQLEQRIENLEKLKNRIKEFKNVGDNDLTSIITVIDNVILDLNTLKSTIENATSTDAIKEARDNINKNYRVYVLMMPQLKIIASSDRITTLVSMMNVVASKFEAKVSSLASTTDATSVNLTQANKTLSELKNKLVQAQTDAQAAVNMVMQLVPDQGDKTVFDSNVKVLKEARLKLKSAHNNLVDSKKDAEAILKILGKGKNVSKNASSTPVKSSN